MTLAIQVSPRRRKRINRRIEQALHDARPPYRRLAVLALDGPEGTHIEHGCGALVDVDPWHAWPDVFAGVPVLCDQHIQQHEETIRARFAARRAAKEKANGLDDSRGDPDLAAYPRR